MVRPWSPIWVVAAMATSSTRSARQRRVAAHQLADAADDQVVGARLGVDALRAGLAEGGAHAVDEDDLAQRAWPPLFNDTGPPQRWEPARGGRGGPPSYPPVTGRPSADGTVRGGVSVTDRQRRPVCLRSHADGAQDVAANSSVTPTKWQDAIMARRRTLTTTALSAATVLSTAACGGESATTAAAAAAAAAAESASGQGRRDPPRHHLLPALGEPGPAEARGGVQGRRCRLRHPERAERRAEDADHRPADDHRRRHRPGDRQPGQRLGRGDRAAGQAAGRADHRLRPAHAGRLGGLLRLLRQRPGRQAPGRGPAEVPRGQGGQHRLPERLARRQQRDPVLPGRALGAGQGQQLHEGRRAGRAQVGRRPGPDDLRADVHPGRRQHPGRLRGQRHAGQRGDPDPQAEQPEDPGDRSGRGRRGPAEHPLR